MPTARRSESPWRTRARAAILEALESGRAAGLAGQELARHVSRAYPFGERRRPAAEQLGLFDGLGYAVGR